MAAIAQNTIDALPDGAVPIAIGPVTPGTGPTNLGKAEDDPHASGDVGVMALAVRNDAGTALAANGDYIPLMVNAAGALYVTSAGGPVGPVTPGTGPTELGKAEDALHASGDVGVMSLGVRSDAGAALAAAGDYIPFIVDAQGRIWIAGSQDEDAIHASGDRGVFALAVRNDAGTALAANGDYIPLIVNSDGSLFTAVTAVTPGTGPSNLGKAEDAIHASGDTGVFALAVAQNVAAPVVFAAAGDYIPFGVDTEGAQWVIGNRRHDDVDAGAPVKIGAKAIAHGTNPTAVAAGDRTDVYANRAGIPFHIGGHPNLIAAEWVFTTAQTNLKIVTVAAGTKIVVVGAECMVDADCTVNVACRVGLAASTLPAISNNSATGLLGLVLSHPDISPGSGVVVGGGGGIIAIGADDDDLIITCDAATGGALRVIVRYFTIES